MTWTEKDTAEFMSMVAPPGVELEGYDDRILYADAVEFAKKTQGDYGEQLLNALLQITQLRIAN
ncbi:MAG: hypothetical protein LBK56_13965 [Gracilibacteraceae bacterium]|jgi:hypothetical protein|nr:hypothetical protein [Gracilibacteraceae bacterium]